MLHQITIAAAIGLVAQYCVMACLASLPRCGSGMGLLGQAWSQVVGPLVTLAVVLLVTHGIMWLVNCVGAVNINCWVCCVCWVINYGIQFVEHKWHVLS